MQILRVLILAAMAAAAPWQRPAPEVMAVKRVVDGNMIELTGYGRVRLAGIHAPRLGQRGGDGQPFARESRDRLDGIVTHRFVRLEFPPRPATGAFVLLEDGTFVNALLVGEGLARVTGHPSGARGEALMRAEAQAREAGRGIWRAR